MGPSIFTAFREQLKLKPESQKRPFEIFESNVLKGLQKLDEDPATGRKPVRGQWCDRAVTDNSRNTTRLRVRVIGANP
jgi:hypothetical protein